MIGEGALGSLPAAPPGALLPCFLLVGSGVSMAEFIHRQSYFLIPEPPKNPHPLSKRIIVVSTKHTLHIMIKDSNFLKRCF